MDYQARKLRRTETDAVSESRKLANLNRRFPTSLKPCVSFYSAEFWEKKASAIEVYAMPADAWTNDMISYDRLAEPMVTGGFMDYHADDANVELQDGVWEQLQDTRYFQA
jgi:hypothetical protein